MNTRDSIFVGLIVTTFGFILNELFKGQTTYLWILGIFLVIILIGYLYQQSRRFPFQKYQFEEENVENGERLLLRKDIPDTKIKLVGKSPKAAVQFIAAIPDWVVFGPYLRQTLRKGKYRATFKVKVDNIQVANQPIIHISVASHTKQRGDKSLAERVLTTLDFKEVDKYYDFPLDFYILSDERDLELRVFSNGSGHTVTVESISLSQRLL